MKRNAQQRWFESGGKGTALSSTFEIPLLSQNNPLWRLNGQQYIELTPSQIHDLAFNDSCK